jgi:hypothetical protein
MGFPPVADNRHSMLPPSKVPRKVEGLPWIGGNIWRASQGVRLGYVESFVDVSLQYALSPQIYVLRRRLVS